MWHKTIQGHVLGAFFYGYLISQIPGGILAERCGGKWVMVVFVCVSTVSTLLTPVAARLSFVLLVVLRMLCGIGSVRHVTHLLYYCSLFYMILRTILCNLMPCIEANTAQKLYFFWRHFYTWAAAKSIFLVILKAIFSIVCAGEALDRKKITVCFVLHINTLSSVWIAQICTVLVSKTWIRVSMAAIVKYS